MNIWHKGWEANSSTLGNQCVLSTTEISLQPKKVSLNRFLNQSESNEYKIA